MAVKTFASDREFLSQHYDLVELKNGNSKILVCPALQGRVFTSTANGDEGASFGWINYNLISSGELLKHCNNWGGEDRFWMGPEGGQFSIFFPPDTNYDISHWQTPAVIDSESWKLEECDATSTVLSKSMDLLNTSGRMLKVEARRKIEILNQQKIEKQLGIESPKGIQVVGFQSTNSLTNGNDFAWDKDTGMLSIWILGQFISTDQTTVILPYNKGGDGQLINDTYFGKIGDQRLKIKEEAFLFNGDGKKRGKIGIGPGRTKPVIGSYDRQNGVLTIVKFSFDSEKTDYVNSMWEHQEEPFSGDVVNSYNDGPLPDGTLMGPFYELETSSPAAHLRPGESIDHNHATFHFEGDEGQLEELSLKLLGVDFKDCF